MAIARRCAAALTGVVALLAALFTPAVAQASPASRAAPAEAAAPAAPTVAVGAGGAPPAARGYLDAIRSGPGWIRVTGWSFDPRRPSAANSENVVVDGRMAALPIANRPRPDVDRALRITGRHGFDVAVPARAGTHRVCVVSRPVAGSGSTWRVLGCRTVRVPSSPVRS